MPKVPRKRVVGWGILAIIVAVLFWTEQYLTDPERIRSLAESFLQERTQGTVTIGSATHSWIDGVRLRDVSLSENDLTVNRLSATPSEPVFFCREIDVSYSPFSAIMGRFKVDSVTAIEPRVAIQRDVEKGRTNWSDLFRDGRLLDRASNETLPTIELRDARFQIFEREGSANRILGDIALSLRARPLTSTSSIYDIVWNRSTGETASGRSQLDLSTGIIRNVWGGLPSISIEAILFALNARHDEAGGWRDLFGLQGTVRVEDFRFGGSADSKEPPSATIALTDAGVSIPMDADERVLPPNERYLRFDKAQGVVALSGEGIQAQFTGLFHGSRCTLSAQLGKGFEYSATLTDAAFEVQLSLEHWDLPKRGEEASPQEQRFVNHWPKLAKIFRDYDPSGPVDLQIAASKAAGTQSPIQVHHVLVRGRGGEACSRVIPYRSRNVSGIIEYNPTGIFINNVQGEHDGGLFTLNGWVAAPKPWAPGDLHVHATGIPIDDALCEILPERFQSVADRFNAEGRVNVDLVLYRPESATGGAAPWHPTCTVELSNASAAFAEFPYPLENMSGKLIADADSLWIQGVHGRHQDAEITINGGAAFQERRLTELSVNILAENVALDENFQASLPESIADHMERLAPTGRFDANTILGLDPETGALVHSTDVTLQDVSLHVAEIAEPITHLQGTITLDKDSIIVHQVEGDCVGGALIASGRLGLPNSTPIVPLSLQIENLRLSDRLRRALPIGKVAFLEKWEIDGPISMRTSVTPDPDRPGAFQVNDVIITLSGVEVRPAAWGDRLTNVHAIIGRESTGFRAEGTASTLGAPLKFLVDAGAVDGIQYADIELSAKNIQLARISSTMLPAEFRSGWDRLKPTGTAELALGKLRYERKTADHHPVWNADAEIKLQDVEFLGDPSLGAWSGTIVGSGTPSDPNRGSLLTGSLKLTGVGANRVQDMSFDGGWSYATSTDHSGRLALRELKGRLHGGLLSGECDWTFAGGQVRYNLAAVIRDMQIASYLEANRSEFTASEKPVDAYGLANVNLHLAGVMGDPVSRRGGGRAEIEDARLYRLPIMSAIFSVLELSMPESQTSQRAEADFFLAGKEVELNNILFQSGGLTLVGSGRVSVPDQGVDIELVSGGSRLRKRFPLIADFVSDASREFVQIRVTGPLSGPRVRLEPFHGVSDELRRLFQKRKPTRIQPAPS